MNGFWDTTEQGFGEPDGSFMNGMEDFLAGEYNDQRCPMCGSTLLSDGDSERCSFIMCDFSRPK